MLLSSDPNTADRIMLQGAVQSGIQWHDVHTEFHKVSQLASQYLCLHLNLAEDGWQNKVHVQDVNRALKRERHNSQKYPKGDKTAYTWTADSTFDWTDSFSTISHSGSDSCCVLDTSSVDLTTSPLAGSRIKAWYNSKWPFTRDLALCHKKNFKYKSSNRKLYLWHDFSSLHFLSHAMVVHSQQCCYRSKLCQWTY